MASRDVSTIVEPRAPDGRPGAFAFAAGGAGSTP
jgi:hypothetical protein